MNKNTKIKYGHDRFYYMVCYVIVVHYTLIPGSLFYCCARSCYNLVSDGIECICLNFDLTQENHAHTAIYPRISIKNLADILSTYSAVNCTISTSKTLTPDTYSEENDFFDAHLFIPNASEYVDTLKDILDEFTTQKIYYKEACSGILKILLTHLYRHSLRTTDNSSDAVSKVLAYIKDNFDKPITNQLLSEITNYHENHLNRLFLSHTGTIIQ